MLSPCTQGPGPQAHKWPLREIVLSGACLKRVLLFKNKSVRSEPLRNTERLGEVIKPSKGGGIGAVATRHSLSAAGVLTPAARVTPASFGGTVGESGPWAQSPKKEC